MDTFVSAVVGDLISRSISLVMDRYRWSQQQGVEESLQRLHRTLLRIQTTVEEADGRRITNQAMLLQLETMRKGMYRGYYMLDSFKRQIIIRDEVSDKHSFAAFPRFNPAAKRLCFSARPIGETAASGGEGMKKLLHEMIGSLENIIADMKEFLVFVSCYPPLLHRQPYCKHLLLENCMFGRHAEQERVVRFLLLEAILPASELLPVLPIIGPARVGKSTLIEHVCHDDKVREHFSLIMLYSGNGIENGSLRDSGVTKHRNLGGSNSKSLFVIELAGDVEEGRWRKILYDLRGECMAPASRVVVTSRSEKIATLGTTEALELNFLPQEAYWYFFKTIAFGSTSSEEQPKLASLSMEIAAEINGSFMAAGFIGGLLRANPSAQFWYNMSRSLKDFTNKHRLLFGEHPNDIISKDEPVYFWRVRRTRSALLVCSWYQASSSAQVDLPRITLQDVQLGSVTPQGKFDALVLTSSIPPYYSYMARCVMQTPSPQMVAKKKKKKKISQQPRRFNLV